MLPIEALAAEVATLRHDLEVARGLLGRAAKVMREWTGYNVWRPLHDDIVSFLGPSAPTTPTVGPPTCQPWCGLALSVMPEGTKRYWLWFDDIVRYSIAFCTPACQDARRPLNPPLPRTDGTMKGTP